MSRHVVRIGAWCLRRFQQYPRFHLGFHNIIDCDLLQIHDLKTNLIYIHTRTHFQCHEQRYCKKKKKKKVGINTQCGCGRLNYRLTIFYIEIRIQEFREIKIENCICLNNSKTNYNYSWFFFNVFLHKFKLKSWLKYTNYNIFTYIKHSRKKK